MPRAPAQLLVVDDNRDSLDMLAILLSQHYRVLGYYSAADAVAAAATAKPDLLVLDIGMEPVDGVQCLKAIRALPQCDRIPAIALTGFARVAERVAFLTSGFQEVVAKPVLDHRKLVALINSVLASAGAPSHEAAPEPTVLPATQGARRLDDSCG